MCGFNSRALKTKRECSTCDRSSSFHRLLTDEGDQKECEISGLEEGPPTQKRCQFPSSYFVAGLPLNNRDETAAGSSEGPTAESWEHQVGFFDNTVLKYLSTNDNILYVFMAPTAVVENIFSQKVKRKVAKTCIILSGHQGPAKMAAKSLFDCL